MSSRLVSLAIGLAAAAVVLCCSSSDDAPAPAPADAGPGDDATGGGNDAVVDAPPPTSSSDYKSGTRLRARILTADGVSLWTAWQDTKLGFDCAFELAEDKKLRCIPTAETLDGVTFSDTDCKNAVLRARPGCAKPTVARLYPPTCGAGVSAFRLGPMSGTTTVYEKSSAGCNPVEVSGFDVYPVTGAIAPAELASATSKQVASSGGLGTVVLDAEDGASQITTLYDTTRKAPCARGGGTKDDRCIPIDLGFEERIYSDMGCATPAAYHPAYAYNCTGAPAIILKEGFPGKCGVYEAQYVEPGPLVTTRPLFRKSASSCDDANISAQETGTYWSFGAALPQTSLPALENVDEGAGRIKLRADATTSSSRLHGRVFFDSDRKAPCAVLPTSDGVERCVPFTTAASLATEYSDDKCEKPVARIEAGCSPSTFVDIFENGPAGCSIPKHRFFEVGAKITPPQVFVLQGANCVPGTLPVGFDLYDAAKEIAPSSFVALVRKTE